MVLFSSRYNVWTAAIFSSCFIARSAEEASKTNPFAFTQPLSDLCPSFASCSTLQPSTDDEFQELIKKRQPAYLSIMSGDAWKSSSWDLWEWASNRWPILHDTLLLTKQPSSVKVDNTDATIGKRNGLGVFNIYDPTDEQAFPDSFSSYTITDEMLLWDFLHDVRSNTSICRFYSTNFRVLEGLAGLEDDTNWRNYFIYDHDVDTELSESMAPMLNLLTPGCVLQARYSEYHTMHIQLQGATRYYLFAPEQVVRHLAIYPALHPSAQQAQVSSDSTVQR
jgi:hypothetical protein